MGHTGSSSPRDPRHVHSGPAASLRPLPRPPALRWASRRPPRRLAGRMSACEWWVLAVISAVTLILYALLLLTLYIMLSRKIASHSCSKQASRSPAAQPRQPPTSSAGGEGVQRPTYLESSDTSSETSDDSDSSPSSPQGPRAEEKLNYTSLVFPGKGCGPGSTSDYENMKTGADYVNVDPKKRKADFWTCSSPVASKSIEYTEVKL
ncbi:regulator of hemoglobinization and erythroid cell expansion protein [Buteo buteo]|uniref:regulator of hemoglobinization and erythroid cell expansion protein n=1 Tax=Buteo buteo TaxID=30397 RepID=UPI003EB7CAF9